MITKPPGVEDIFPDKGIRWNHIVKTAQNVFRNYNYREIITPIMEFTEVFSRGIGDDTDIVSKEMFTFEDRGGRSLTLRPEGTAGIVRAYVENGDYNRLALCKFFYMGPMFRAEKPQRGRLRQFNQLGAEIFGSEDPYYDYEIISLVDSIAKNTGVKNYQVLVNSIGCRECRPDYMVKLREYYEERKENLCEDCSRRLEKNPLRLLDCKKEKCSALKPSAPVISEHLCKDCADHFDSVKSYLDKDGLKYEIDRYMVRGLDYYTRTTFEFVSDSLGSQSAFAGGGRYDYLVEQFDGRPTPGVGFAAGMERIYLLIENEDVLCDGVDAFVVHSGGETLLKGISLVNSLRSSGISADIEPAVKSFKAQFKRADRENASFALIIGEDEILEGTASVKNQISGEQVKIRFDEIPGYIKNQGSSKTE
jgi:histidyl-tRNA synthetase